MSYSRFVKSSVKSLSWSRSSEEFSNTNVILILVDKKLDYAARENAVKS